MRPLTTLRFSPIVLLTYIVLFMIPEVVQLNTSRWWDPIVATIFNLALYATVAWALCLIANMGGKRGRCVVHIIFHTLLAAYVVSSLFLTLCFHRHWDAYTIQFVYETNWREAKEFLLTYLFSWSVGASLLLVVVLFTAEVMLSRRGRQLSLVPKARWARTLWGAWLLLMLGHAYFFSFNADENFDRTARCFSPIKRNAFWNLWQSCLKYGEFRAEFERCATVQQQYNEHPQCAETEADLVFIIGESFSRHMSNLYDGAYNTNPLLMQRLRTDKGRLFVFTNAIATDNGTTQNFKYFMSTTSVDQKGVAWCDSPLFPTILRRCGYNVTFYSNQFAPNDNLGQWDASMGFVNHPGIEPYLFNHRNTQKYDYDLPLITDYAQHRAALERPQRNLTIFHLYGQHVGFAMRFPPAFARFKAGDVSKRYAMRPTSKSQLDQAQRQDVADYLNATAYNDVVVDSIIRLFERRNALIVYFSDHGEEVHNFRRQAGRTDLSTDTPEAFRCQLDVPLLIYMTPQYLKLHPQQAQRVASALHRKFTTDNLPHLLFDLLGVHSRYFDPSRSIINEHYVEPHKSLLQNGREY